MSKRMHRGGPKEAKKRVRNTWVRLFISYFASFMLPFLLLGTALILITSRYTTRETVNAHALWTATVFRELQNMDSQMSDVQSQLLWDSSIPDMVFPDAYSECERLRQRLYTLKTSGKHFRTIWYSTSEDQYLFSDTGTMSTEMFTEWRYPDAAENADTFRKLVLSSAVPTAVKSLDRVYGDQVLMLFYPVWHIPHTRSIVPLLHHVCFVIPESAFASVLSETVLNQDYDVACLFRDKVLWSSGGTDPNMQMLSFSEAKEILPNLNASPVELYRNGSDTVLKIGQGYWTMTVRIPNLFSGHGSFVLYAVMLSVSFFAVGCCLSVRRARQIFRPIANIRQRTAQLTDSEEEMERSEDVFGTVQQHLLQLSAQKGILTDQLKNNRFMTESLVAHLLLYGTCDSPELSNALALLPDVLQSKHCCRVILILTELEAEKVHGRMRPFFSETDEYTLLCVKSSIRGGITAILFYPPENEKEVSGRLNAFAASSPEMLIGISDVENERTRIPIMLLEAACALNGRLKESTQNLFYSESGWTGCTDESKSEERKTGKQLIEQISQSAEAMINPEAGAVLCGEVLELLKKELPEPSLHPAVYAQAFLEPYTAAGEDRPADLRPVAHLLRETVKKTEEEPVEEQMRSYIQVRYTQSDFSLKNMADEFHMSESGLSNYFNKQFGQSVLDYLTQLRMKLAVTLLCETQKSIQEISAMIGYINANSFIRRFKQIMGETPGEFRRNNAPALPGGQAAGQSGERPTQGQA